MPAIVGTGKHMLMSYGLPLAGLAAGWFIGDIGLKGLISGVIPASMNIPDASINILAAAAYFGIGVALWTMVPYVGGFIGGLLVGMGIKLIMNAVSKKEA